MSWIWLSRIRSSPTGVCGSGSTTVVVVVVVGGVVGGAHAVTSAVAHTSAPAIHRIGRPRIPAPSSPLCHRLLAGRSHGGRSPFTAATGGGGHDGGSGGGSVPIETTGRSEWPG